MAAITDLATLVNTDVTSSDRIPIYDASGATDMKTGLFTTGSWTPILQFGGGTTGITYSAQTGYYIRIGNALIWIACRIVLTSKGSSTGAATIGNLPATVAVVASPLACTWTALGSSVTTMQAIISGGSSISLLYTTGSTSYATATDTIFGNTTTLNIGGIYAAA